MVIQKLQEVIYGDIQKIKEGIIMDMEEIILENAGIAEWVDKIAKEALENQKMDNGTEKAEE